MRTNPRFTSGDVAACTPPACALLLLLGSKISGYVEVEFFLLATLAVAFLAIGAVGMCFLLHLLGDLVELTWSWSCQRRQFARVAVCLSAIPLFYLPALLEAFSGRLD